jgi:hypothetical protein
MSRPFLHRTGANHDFTPVRCFFVPIYVRAFEECGLLFDGSGQPIFGWNAREACSHQQLDAGLQDT